MYPTYSKRDALEQDLIREETTKSPEEEAGAEGSSGSDTYRTRLRMEIGKK
jgi:hypothetical protein